MAWLASTGMYVPVVPTHTQCQAAHIHLSPTARREASASLDPVLNIHTPFTSLSLIQAHTYVLSSPSLCHLSLHTLGYVTLSLLSVKLLIIH